MGLSTINFGKSEIQESKGEEGKLYRNRDSLYMHIFGQQSGVEYWKRAPSMFFLKEIIVWLFFYAGNEARVPVK